MADDTAKIPTIEERIAALQPVLANAVKEKWAALGIEEGTKVRDHKEVVVSGVFDDDVQGSPCVEMAEAFIAKVKETCAGKKVVALGAPACDVHSAGLTRIAGYVHVVIGFI